MEEEKRMKCGGLLHPELAFQIASCGHRDLICIADAGLPLPRNVPRIDLAYAPGKPPFFDVLKTVLQEVALEEVCWAEEAAEKSPHLVQRFEDLFRGSPRNAFLTRRSKPVSKKCASWSVPESSLPTRTCFSAAAFPSEAPRKPCPSCRGVPDRERCFSCSSVGSCSPSEPWNRAFSRGRTC